MDDAVRSQGLIEASGLRVRVDLAVHVASLRYFDPKGSFAARVGDLTGAALPTVLKATRVPASPGDFALILAWRSPTETLVLSADEAHFSRLKAALTGATDGCIVDQSGGLRMLRVSGERIFDLLTRLGGTTSVPEVGEARRSRLADVSVLALCVQAGETLLVVDRIYAEHLLAWIRETVADFDIP